MTIIDTNKIQALFDSKISAYAIEKDTDIRRMTITNYRNGKADILNMSLDKAIKLQEFWEEYIMEEYETLKTFIENDYAEKDFGRGDLEEFNPEKIMNGETVEVLSDDFGPKRSRVKVVISLDEIKLNDTLDAYTVNFMDKEVYVYYVSVN
ncbi:hypothetical protein P7H24_12615 [Enterococcus thailandicus]|uniref:hypothetical protein n=1 Tax=Enterococcus TaxID=1350 RepID=UPI0028927094|nr:hypothetical protein [Enterococcus thailandicus]MDT2735307.1 hypothetical protein [Enterococcus thailandicus]